MRTRILLSSSLKGDDGLVAKKFERRKEMTSHTDEKKTVLEAVDYGDPQYYLLDRLLSDMEPLQRVVFVTNVLIEQADRKESALKLLEILRQLYLGHVIVGRAPRMVDYRAHLREVYPRLPDRKPIESRDFPRRTAWGPAATDLRLAILKDILEGWCADSSGLDEKLQAEAPVSFEFVCQVYEQSHDSDLQKKIADLFRQRTDNSVFTWKKRTDLDHWILDSETPSPIAEVLVKARVVESPRGAIGELRFLDQFGFSDRGDGAKTLVEDFMQKVRHTEEVVRKLMSQAQPREGERYRSYVLAEAVVPERIGMEYTLTSAATANLVLYADYGTEDPDELRRITAQVQDLRNALLNSDEGRDVQIIVQARMRNGELIN